MTVYWGTSDGETTPGSWDNSVDLGIKGSGTFSTDVTSLTPSTRFVNNLCLLIPTLFRDLNYKFTSLTPNINPEYEVKAFDSCD